MKRNKFSIGNITEQDIESLYAIWTTYYNRYNINGFNNNVPRVMAILRWNRLHLDNKKRIKKFKKPGQYKKSPKSSPTRTTRQKN